MTPTKKLSDRGPSDRHMVPETSSTSSLLSASALWYGVPGINAATLNVYTGADTCMIWGREESPPPPPHLCVWGGGGGG